jgi:hypothetical protein
MNGHPGDRYSSEVSGRRKGAAAKCDDLDASSGAGKSLPHITSGVLLRSGSAETVRHRIEMHAGDDRFAPLRSMTASALLQDSGGKTEYSMPEPAGGDAAAGSTGTVDNLPEKGLPIGLDTPFGRSLCLPTTEP